MIFLETAIVDCPYCGESNELLIDTSVPEQEYIEDCRVCCRPIQVRVVVTSEGDWDVAVRSENEGF
ncbi:MAG: CPXCG motif-containing cysteine-rich protein [Pseudomonadota bacterium]